MALGLLLTLIAMFALVAGVLFIKAFITTKRKVYFKLSIVCLISFAVLMWIVFYLIPEIYSV